VGYLKAFLDFSPVDGEALIGARSLIAPLVPTILDLVYSKLLSFDITSASFVPRNTDFQGNVPKNLSDLSLDKPQIKYRMSFLKGYLVKLVSEDNFADNALLWQYMET
jgi:hypothetical protein